MLRLLPRTLVLLLLFGFSNLAVAGDGYVRILTPADGATLDEMDQNRVEFDVDPGPAGDSVRLFVDDQEVAVLREFKGSYTLDTMDSGPHRLCVKVLDKSGHSTGLEQCIGVTAR